MSGEAGRRLCEWVAKHGGFVWRGLRIAQDGRSGLGLFAAEKLSPGQTLISLPSHLPLSLPDASSDTLSPPDANLLSLVDRVPAGGADVTEELWALRLGLKLLSEKAKENSFWWPYICLLPERYQVPIFFSGEEIASLQYPPLIHQVKKRCHFLGKLASTEIPSYMERLSLEQHPFGGQQVDAGALGWAMAAVSSRAFCVHSTARATNRMLLPLIDMCNHSFTPNARLEQVPLSNDNDYELQVVVESSLEEGMPIALNYGSLSNDLLLMDYGFIVAENPHECVELKFDGSLLDIARLVAGMSNEGLPSLASPAPWQQEALAQLRLQGDEASLRVTLGGPELVDGRLLAALRILYADDESQLRHEEVQHLQQWGSQPPLGFVNECNVLQTLAALSALVLTRSFPTSVEEDRELLTNLNVQDTRRVIIEYRLNKKQLLLYVINKLQGKLKSLKIENMGEAQHLSLK